MCICMDSRGNRTDQCVGQLLIVHLSHALGFYGKNLLEQHLSGHVGIVNATLFSDLPLRDEDIIPCRQARFLYNCWPLGRRNERGELFASAMLGRLNCGPRIHWVCSWPNSQLSKWPWRRQRVGTRAGTHLWLFFGRVSFPGLRLPFLLWEPRHS